jgi:hypothetical protein
MCNGINIKKIKTEIIKTFISILLLTIHVLSVSSNPEWTHRYNCGQGLNCLGLDPPADGCYYNLISKIGWCYHIVEGKGSIYFAGKQIIPDELTEEPRLMQTSSCTLGICNQCERACYRADCKSPEDCATCTCLTRNPSITFLGNDWCCPLPENINELN